MAFDYYRICHWLRREARRVGRSISFCIETLRCRPAVTTMAGRFAQGDIRKKAAIALRAAKIWGNSMIPQVEGKFF